MPCTQTGSLEGDRALAAQEAIDKRERMLCGMCSMIEKEVGVPTMEAFLEAIGEQTDGLKKKDIVKWWRAHKKAEGR